MLSAQLGSGCAQRRPQWRWRCPQWQGQLAFCPVLHPTIPLGLCLACNAPISSHVLLLGTACLSEPEAATSSN